MPASFTTTLTHAAAILATLTPYLALGAVLFALLALLSLSILERRLSRMSAGAHGSLEELMGIHTHDIKELQAFRAEVEKYLKLSEMRLRGAVGGVGLVRFNPFEGQGQGGNQSFSAAFLDEYGSGMVLSTLYSRDRVGVYAKPLVGFASTYELTAEEKQAIAEAKESLASHKKK